MRELERHGVRAALLAAIEAARDRSVELGARRATCTERAVSRTIGAAPRLRSTCAGRPIGVHQHPVRLASDTVLAWRGAAPAGATRKR